jgi:hypothetical protein
LSIYSEREKIGLCTVKIVVKILQKLVAIGISEKKLLYGIQQTPFDNQY